MNDVTPERIPQAWLPIWLWPYAHRWSITHGLVWAAFWISADRRRRWYICAHNSVELARKLAVASADDFTL
jgi:hypothetical protein